VHERPRAELDEESAPLAETSIPRWFFRVLPPPVYHRIRRVPLVGTAVRRLIDAFVPKRGLLLTRVHSGPLGGMVLELDPRMQIDAVIGRYEAVVQEVIEEVLDGGRIAVDIGAHLGYFTLLMASHVREGGRVVSFEPDPTIVRGLVRNVERNRAISGAEIVVVPAAVDEMPGRAAFRVGRETSRGRLSGEGDLEVEVMTLDDVSDRFGGAALIKIDVEGREVGVLSGGERTLSAKRTVFIVEAHSEDLQRQCRVLLERHGYRAEVLRERGRAESYVVARP
jgi:FkbM family methyltransferase